MSCGFADLALVRVVPGTLALGRIGALREVYEQSPVGTVSFALWGCSF